MMIYFPIISYNNNIDIFFSRNSGLFLFFRKKKSIMDIQLTIMGII